MKTINDSFDKIFPGCHYYFDTKRLPLEEQKLSSIDCFPAVIDLSLNSFDFGYLVEEII